MQHSFDNNCEIYQSMTKCPLPRPQFICIYDYTIVNMQEGDSSFLQQANCSRFLLLLLCDIKEKNPKVLPYITSKPKKRRSFIKQSQSVGPVLIGLFQDHPTYQVLFRATRMVIMQKGRNQIFTDFLFDKESFFQFLVC